MLLSLVGLECCHVEESARSCDKQSKRYRRRPSWPSVRPPSWGCSPRLFTFHLPSYSLTVGSLPLRPWIWRGDLTTKWEHWDKSPGSLGRDEWSFRVQPFLAQNFFWSGSLSLNFSSQLHLLLLLSKSWRLSLSCPCFEAVILSDLPFQEPLLDPRKGGILGPPGATTWMLMLAGWHTSEVSPELAPHRHLLHTFSCSLGLSFLL